MDEDHFLSIGKRRMPPSQGKQFDIQSIPITSRGNPERWSCTMLPIN
jgi:hypothetical protein